MRFNIQFKMLTGYVLVVLLVSAGSWWSYRILQQTWDNQAALADVRGAEESLEVFTNLSSLEDLDRLRLKSLSFDPRPYVIPEAGAEPEGQTTDTAGEFDYENSYANRFVTGAEEIERQLFELEPVLERLDDSAWMRERRAGQGARGLLHALRGIEADFAEYRRLFHRELGSPPAETDVDPLQKEYHPLVETIKLRIANELVTPVINAGHDLKRTANEHKTEAEKLVALLPMVPGIVAIFLSLLITRRIANPIRELRRATERIAGGDFTQPIRVKSRDEVGDLARAMNRMSQRLAELDEMKSGFLFNVSHELKTPLTSIKEAAALLQEEVPGPVNEKQTRLLEIISAETRILIGMILDLLDLARMEAGRMGYRLQRTSAGAVVRQAVDSLQFLAQRRGVTLTVDEAPQLGYLYLDRDKMVNAVKNLVNNALKFSPRGGEVLISTRLAPPVTALAEEGLAVWSTSGSDTEGRVRAPSVLISVSDQGPGIPEKDLSRVFDKFFQSERRSDSKVKGTGLGLSIVRHVVEAHDGSVAVQSAPESGSTFSIFLPLPVGTDRLKSKEHRQVAAPLEVEQNVV